MGAATMGPCFTRWHGFCEVAGHYDLTSLELPLL